MSSFELAVTPRSENASLAAEMMRWRVAFPFAVIRGPPGEYSTGTGFIRRSDRQGRRRALQAPVVAAARNPATLSGLRASRIVSGHPSGFVSERCREW